LSLNLLFAVINTQSDKQIAGTFVFSLNVIVWEW
jgi:hypothetical protein